MLSTLGRRVHGSSDGSHAGRENQVVAKGAALHRADKYERESGMSIIPFLRFVDSPQPFSYF